MPVQQRASPTHGISTWTKPALKPDEAERVIALCDKEPLQPAEVEQFRDGARVRLQDTKHRGKHDRRHRVERRDAMVV